MTIDMRTRYLGLDLASPLVVSACPLGDDLEALRRMEACGAAAVVLPSLFEEQVVLEEIEVHGLYEFGTESFAESLSYFPPLERYPVGPSRYLERLRGAKRAVSIPVIASLNGTTTGGWVRYASLIEDAGADGLVLFNRFVHPDVDLETLRMKPHLALSRSYDARLPLTWIGLLREHLACSLAATSGVHTPEDALKLLLVGADVTMIASALYERGVDHLRTVLEGLRRWMIERGYASVEQMKGSLSRANCEDPEAYTRAGYMRTLTSFSTPRAGA